MTNSTTFVSKNSTFVTFSGEIQSKTGKIAYDIGFIPNISFLKSYPQSVIYLPPLGIYKK